MKTVQLIIDGEDYEVRVDAHPFDVMKGMIHDSTDLSLGDIEMMSTETLVTLYEACMDDMQEQIDTLSDT